MKSTNDTLVTLIPLEKPASIRRQFPLFDERGWMISDFVCGPENCSLRHLFDPQSLLQLASLSPVVLYGDKNTGKTALAITLSVCWARATNQRPLCFTTGKSFAEDYAAAVEIDDLGSFRARFRQCKLLVIDDFEPVTEKPAAQSELIHTLDSHAASASPVIVTSGKLPASLTHIDAALSSRLSGGYSACLHKPLESARREILSLLIKRIDASLSLDDLDGFCRGLSQSLSAPDLSAIATLAHQNMHEDGGLNLAALSALVHQYLSGNALSVSLIAKAVARKMRVKLSDMRGSTRQANIVRARGLAIFLSRRLTPASLQQIGLYFGGRDHSTVLHACRKTEGLVVSDAELSKAMAELQADLLN